MTLAQFLREGLLSVFVLAEGGLPANPLPCRAVLLRSMPVGDACSQEIRSLSQVPSFFKNRTKSKQELNVAFVELRRETGEGMARTSMLHEVHRYLGLSMLS